MCIQWAFTFAKNRGLLGPAGETHAHGRLNGDGGGLQVAVSWASRGSRRRTDSWLAAYARVIRICRAWLRCPAACTVSTRWPWRRSTRDSVFRTHWCRWRWRTSSDTRSEPNTTRNGPTDPTAFRRSTRPTVNTSCPCTRRVWLRHTTGCSPSARGSPCRR